MTKTRNILFAELSQSEPSKPFDGLAAGTFTDMYGRSITVRREELPTYLSNTRKLIDSTMDSQGNAIGLPIDQMNHNHGDAAGFIVGVDMAEGGDKLVFTPRWNPVGEGLIQNDIQRFFSATFDVSNKVVMGGSLTNWPATRSQKGDQILLKPIELSAGLYELDSESLNGRLSRIVRSFQDRFWRDIETSWSLWVLEVFDDYLICQNGEELFRVSYSENGDGDFDFPPVAEWTKVKVSYVEAAIEKAMSVFKSVFSRFLVQERGLPADPDPGVTQPPATEGADDMPENQTPELAALLSANPALAEQLNAVINTRVQSELTALLDAEKRKAHVAEFSARVTSGARALPVEASELEKFLSSLSAEQQEAAEILFGKISETGNIDFTEKGHSRTLAGSQPLPVWAKSLLSEWIDGGGKIADFFRVNAVELGSQADYDLTEFKEKGE